MDKLYTTTTAGTCIIGNIPNVWTDSSLINNNKKMKETSIKNFEIVYQRTEVTKHTYNVLAESEDEAKKFIKENGFNSKSETVSVDIVQVK